MATASSVCDKDFGESYEPSVLSAFSNERKLARRLRIQRRAEALQKVNGEEENVFEESVTEKQILASAELLEKLIAEGNEVISNVRIANDAREIERRKEAADIRDKLLQHLEIKTNECKIQYNTINDKWLLILESNDPLDIKHEMELQKKKCDDVIAKKDEVITELQKELQKADDKYFEDHRKQKDDIKLLIERIENQMATMENVTGRELELIEKALTVERHALTDGFQKKWDGLYKQQKEADNMSSEKRKLIMTDYEKDMDNVMIEHDEQYRAQKIKLEKQCQILQLQVEKTKAVCLLNVEKLSYNYTILKNREEENSIMKSQQKRKINKLQGVINSLKKTYLDLEENTKLEIDNLSNQILKSHKNILELESKSNYFTRVNEKQYMDIWNMNSENADQLVAKILAADKIIHECTLGILWDPPENTLPKKEDLPSFSTAMNIIKKKKEDEVQRLKLFEYKNVEKSSSDERLEREVLNNILKQISDCSGYLIEDKLQQLISSCTEEEKTIIRLDNVFQVLAITTPEEINMLIDFFLPYSYCPICLKKEDNIEISKSSLSSSESSSCIEVCAGCIDENVQKLVKSVKEEINTISYSSDSGEESQSFPSYNSLNDANENSSRCTEYKAGSKKLMCNQGHVLEIQAAHVTKAMKEIVTKYNAVEQKNLSFQQRLKEKKYTVSRNVSAEDITNYWSNYQEIFDNQKEKLWDTVLMGLQKYYEILKERHQLCYDTKNLKKQNAELEHLLKSHTIAGDGLSLLEVKSTSANKI